jgi:hypothetical protein
MSYIGREPQIGNFQVCDAISTVNNQAAYTLQVGGVNVSPESANHMIVSLNGVIQKPTDAFTVSGSTITFAANLVTGDVINFIQILGNVLDLGVPSDATVSTAKIVDGAVTAAKINSAVGLGKVLQVVSVTKTDTFTTSSSSFTDITGLTANITPASTSNKVYVQVSIQGSQDVSTNRVSVKLLRGSTAIAVGDSAGSRSQASSGLSSPHADLIVSSSVTFLDSPSSSSQQTYKMQTAVTAGSGNSFINRTENDSDGSGTPRYASTITLMEIAG